MVTRKFSIKWVTHEHQTMFGKHSSWICSNWTPWKVFNIYSEKEMTSSNWENCDKKIAIKWAMYEHQTMFGKHSSWLCSNWTPWKVLNIYSEKGMMNIKQKLGPAYFLHNFFILYFKYKYKYVYLFSANVFGLQHIYGNSISDTISHACSLKIKCVGNN